MSTRPTFSEPFDHFWDWLLMPPDHEVLWVSDDRIWQKRIRTFRDFFRPAELRPFYSAPCLARWSKIIRKSLRQTQRMRESEVEENAK